MFFAVQELEHHKIHFDTAYQPGEIPFVEGKIWQRGPLEVRGSAELLNNTLGEIRVRGHLKVQMEAECDRCLETAAFPLDAPFDLFYRPADTAPVHEETRIDAGESEIAFYEGLGLELADVIREFVLLELPMQTVCSEACKGICAVCGQNLNKGDCHCEQKPVDDRWAALRNLK
ncbi:MAG: DUF177 domain-containing protein [Bryobacteraceae bacterium]|nr:DUF177 domain-containing protein [Bryobacteraceae bacterium]